MSSTSKICHKGIITNVLQNEIEVTIEAKSACASCHSKSACTVSDVENKIIRVQRNHSEQYTIGELVQLTLAQKKGFEALFLGYLFPFLLLFITLVIALHYTSELFAGLLSLSILLPYYIVLYFLQNRIRERFLFQIERI